MRFLFFALYRSMILVAVLGAFPGFSHAAQASLTTVTIQQRTELFQGKTAEFEVRIAPENQPHRIILQLRCDVGTGKAVFEDDSTEMAVEKSQSVRVRGVVSNDVPGAIALTAWLEGVQIPTAMVFIDVFPQPPELHIFSDGMDVTGTHQTVTVGQRTQLTVILHPGLPVQSQSWSIGNPGEYTGGFLHTPFLGGPQPIVRRGPTTLFYWVTPGDNRVVSYQLTLTNGVTVKAEVTFDAEGPHSPQVEVDAEKVAIAQPTPNSSLLGLLEPGISFRARYDLPEGMMKNFTWVQVIQSDIITIQDNDVALRCVPKSQPVAKLGAGLDTVYPYDTHNPTLDNPRIHLPADVKQYSRALHARMYLLWTSSLSNSIAVPLGFVEWTFSGDVLLKNAKTSEWILRSGSGGPHDPVAPFTRSHAYPIWNSLVPYTQVLTCN